jgi:hypothetical protein
MKQPEPFRGRKPTFPRAETRPSYKESYMNPRSGFSGTERRPSIEELEAAASPELGFAPDPALLPRSRRGRQFLHGPLDWGDICHIANASRMAVLVWLLIHHRRKLTGEVWLTLPTRDLSRLGISLTGKRRALKVLEDEGFIRVQRVRGRTTLVMLVREG